MFTFHGPRGHSARHGWLEEGEGRVEGGSGCVHAGMEVHNCTYRCKNVAALLGVFAVIVVFMLVFVAAFCLFCSGFVRLFVSFCLFCSGFVGLFVSFCFFLLVWFIYGWVLLVLGWVLFVYWLVLLV